MQQAFLFCLLGIFSTTNTWLEFVKGGHMAHTYSTFPNSHSPHVDCGIENRALLIESNHAPNNIQGQ